jgi:luciferase family oxidoreductase group 1
VFDVSQTSPVPLSVLDLAPVVSGSTSSRALHNTLELAKHVEQLGYTRFWLAEHHNMAGIASSAPAVLVGAVASVTSTLRVGSGGVMLPNHPPLVVAEQFGMLEGLYPGRIDLGLGRAPGTDPRTAAALRRSAAPLSADDFPQQLGELLEYFGDDPDAPRDGGLHAVPAAGNQPPVWLLGSSLYSAQLAGLLGLPFAFAHHFSSENTLPAARAYRANFRPSEALQEPYLLIAAGAWAADDDERARYLAAPSALQWLRLRQGKPTKLPTPEDAADYPYSEMERLVAEDRVSGQIVGGPDTVRRGIDELVAATGANELMLTTSMHSFEDRKRSYELIAGLWTADVHSPAGSAHSRS